VLLLVAIALCCAIVDAKPRKSPALDIWYKNRAKTFHEAWGKQEGVVTLENGLQYKVLEKGAGLNPQHPVDTDELLMRYQVFIPDDEPPYRHLIGANVFYNRETKDLRGNGTVMKFSQLFDGWRRGAVLMTEGEVWELYIPSSMAYGGLGRSDTRPAIPIFSPLIVTMWLDKINPPPAAKPDEGAAADPLSKPTGASQQDDEEEEQEL